MRQPAVSPVPTDDVSELDAAIIRARSGDREAYRHVIIGVEAAVRIVVAAIVPDRTQVDDVAQEVFITAWGKLDDYQAGSDPARWFKAIARNLALNARRGWLRQEEARRTYRSELEHLLEPATMKLADSAESRLLELLDECLKALGESALAIVREHYWDGHAPEAIAATRGRQPGWARVTLHRARTALAECLRTKGVSRG